MNQEQIEREILAQIMADHQIRSYGVCDYRQIRQFLPCRNRERIPADAKSVIVCAFPYYTGEHPGANVCKYAMVPDYHVVVRQILNRACQDLEQACGGAFVAFADVSALPEHHCAMAAGLGAAGVNGLVIHPEYGSFFVIGEIVTDRLLEFDAPRAEQMCMRCGKCIQNCPAGAIRWDGIDYSRCLSQITQQKGELTPGDQALIRRNRLMWGCDACQNCCPHNAHVPLTHLGEFRGDVQPVVTGENLSALCKTRAFGYRGKTLLRRNLALLAPEEPPASRGIDGHGTE